MNKKRYDVKIWFEKESKLYVITAHKNGKELVATQGKTFIEAFRMLGEAIKLMEDYKDKGNDTKEPRYLRVCRKMSAKNPYGSTKVVEIIGDINRNENEVKE